MRMQSRLLNQIYAYLFEYFWRECPRCGKMFGGHEVIGHVAVDEKRGLAACCGEYEVMIGGKIKTFRRRSNS